MSHGPFDQMVPGRIGDPRAGYDPIYNGAGWLYVDDPDYIVYSSLDYDSAGVDISGSNFNDWPIRLVNGRRTYVPDPLERHRYPPVYLSDEDMFSVFKDTDTRADRLYRGPNGPSEPIGIEVHNSVYTWGTGPGKDIVLFQYDIINKSGEPLDSCFVVFGTGIRLTGPSGSGLSRRIEVHSQEPWRNLVYVMPTRPGEWPQGWTATPKPPTLGFTLLETPRDADAIPLGLTAGVSWWRVGRYRDSTGLWRTLWTAPSDSIAYWVLTHPDSGRDPLPDFPAAPVLITGPFQMAVDETVRTTVGFLFAENLEHLLLMHDLIYRMYGFNLQRPSPPPSPRLTAKGLNRAVLLRWDGAAEGVPDIIVPDSLGRPFVGYRLLRAVTADGPYQEIARWHIDTFLVYEYLDRGEDIGGLKNNVTYYYQLLAFDEGAPRLKLDPMQSPAVEGVNMVSVVPTTEPADATSHAAGGALVSGTLGDLSLPRLLPTNVTNFNTLMSGRTLKIDLGAATDGVRYTLPVTIRDTVAGRVHNALIDPDLFVHGSPPRAGIVQGTARIGDIFTIGAANIEFDYRFEQLPDSFRIDPITISSAAGADVPIIINDSLGVTGIMRITPYTSARRELTLEFLPGGLDTLGRVITVRIVPYLAVRVRDSQSGDTLIAGVDYAFHVRGIRTSGGGTLTGRDNRYYLSGTLPNGESWDFGHMLEVYESKIAFDFADHGQGSGKPAPYFEWASPHRSGTVDFQAGDTVHLTWQGGVRAEFPRNAHLTVTGPPAGRTEVTEAMMEAIRIVPNPYIVRHEAQRGQPRLYFNYLPEECTIRIYTLALDLVRTIHHRDGSRAEWDLTTEGGQLVASQMLLAHIEAPNAKTVVKKFAVVVGR